MQIGIGIGIVSMVEIQFSPAHLFQPGNIGMLFDPSNLTTLSQNSAGTTPVTAAGQPVGLMRDMSGGVKNAIQTQSAGRPTYRVDVTGGPYLEFDGINNFMGTTFFSWGGSDEVTLIAAVRKRLDSNEEVIAEWGPNSAVESGTFGLLVPGGGIAGYRSRSRGTAGSEANVSAGYPAGGNHVVTMRAKIGTDLNALRVNGADAGSSAADQGSFGFSSRNMYIGRRFGTSLPAAIDLYGLIAINRLLTSSELQQSEQWAASRMGVAL